MQCFTTSGITTTELLLGFGHSRFHRRISTSTGRPRVHSVRLIIHESDHHRDGLLGQFRIPFTQFNRGGERFKSGSQLLAQASKHQNQSVQWKSFRASFSSIIVLQGSKSGAKSQSAHICGDNYFNVRSSHSSRSFSLPIQ